MRNVLQKGKSEIALLDSQKHKTDVESQVLRKGIPEAEIKNDFFDIIRPYVKKVKDAATTSPKQLPLPKVRIKDQR